MTSRFSELCIDCHDPSALAAFWKEVLGYEDGEPDPSGELVELVDPEGSGPALVFVRVPEEKVVKNRVHIDVSPRDREQPDEVERIIALGARKIDVGQGDDATWVVMADPEGNEFCVLRTRRP